MKADAIRVCIAGHRGKVGSVLAAAFAGEPGIEYVGGISHGDDLATFLHEKRPRALVDFTRPSEALHNSLAAVASGASPVVGTTGLTATDVDKLETACRAKGLGGIRFHDWRQAYAEAQDIPNVALFTEQAELFTVQERHS